MTHNEFVPRELVLKLNDLGFNEHCYFLYWKKGCYTFSDGHISVDLVNVRMRDVVSVHDYGTLEKPVVYAPTYYQVFRWFREKHKMEAEIRNIEYSENHYNVFISSYIHGSLEKVSASCYDEAQEFALIRLIEILREKINFETIDLDNPELLRLYGKLNKELEEYGQRLITLQEALKLGLTADSPETIVNDIVGYFVAEEERGCNENKSHDNYF